MGFTANPTVSVPTTVSAAQYTHTLLCDFDLQSLADAVAALKALIAATGEGDMKSVGLAFKIPLDVLSVPTGLEITATWKA